MSIASRMPFGASTNASITRTALLSEERECLAVADCFDYAEAAWDGGQIERRAGREGMRRHEAEAAVAQGQERQTWQRCGLRTEAACSGPARAP